jgi:hypothetical protein
MFGRRAQIVVARLIVLTVRVIRSTSCPATSKQDFADFETVESYAVELNLIMLFTCERQSDKPVIM